MNSLSIIKWLEMLKIETGLLSVVTNLATDRSLFSKIYFVVTMNFRQNRRSNIFWKNYTTHIFGSMVSFESQIIKHEHKRVDLLASTVTVHKVLQFGVSSYPKMYYFFILQVQYKFTQNIPDQTKRTNKLKYMM